MDRRDFLQVIALVGVAACSEKSMIATDDSQEVFIKPNTGSWFTVWQLPSQLDTIGNSYVFRTRSGKVIVMDGGTKVDAWFISHPHHDHIGALTEILKKPDGLEIKHIYHSRITDTMITRHLLCKSDS